jgi:NitT/TauT family transport system permease protein/sulfonate transport system permease protein
MENITMKIEKKDFMEVKDKKKLTFLTIFNIVAPFLSLSGLLLLWLYASSINAELVAPPVAIKDRLVMLFVKPIGGLNLFGHIWTSLRRVLIALLASCTLGILFGVMIGWSKTAKAIFGTLFELLRPIPPLAWLPLVIMWFGIGEFPKILIIFIGTFTPVAINTFTGIDMVQPLHLDVGRIFNATNKQLLTEIAIPSALPAIFAGVRTATSAGWMVVLAAEMIAAKAGLGFLVYRGMQFFDVSLIILSMLVIGVVGTILAIITNYVERWLCPWNKKLGQD